MDEQLKEVYFDGHCDKCIYRDTPECDEPCYECLATPVRPFSHTPLNFKRDLKFNTKHLGKKGRKK